jgi:nitrate reductase gamma subunit
MLYSFYSMLFDWSIFFYMLLEHILFFMTPLSFCRNTRREISLNFGVFIFGGWMACFA